METKVEMKSARGVRVDQADPQCPTDADPNADRSPSYRYSPVKSWASFSERKSQMTDRPSQFVGMRVQFIQNDIEKSHNTPVRFGRVVDVLFTSFGDDGGMVNDRVKVIVLLDTGRLREAYVNQLEAEIQN